jgi:ribulose-5-phosphate 4-epimerase/fuculose-1-phosphate aldolase
MTSRLGERDDRASMTSATPCGEVSAAEWQVRLDLAALYRGMNRFGMTDFIYNHITASVPGEPGHFLINPYGLLYSEIRASSFYKIDLEGRIVSAPQNALPLNPGGFVIHSAVHAARPDAICVLHAHTRAGMAVAAMRCGLLPLTQQACKFVGRVSYHDFEGPAIDVAERERLVCDLGSNNIMFLRNHGTLICGGSVAQTFLDAYLLENACKVQIDVLAAGTDYVLPAEPVLQRTREIFDTHGQDALLEWSALLRLLDADDDSYRN